MKLSRVHILLNIHKALGSNPSDSSTTWYCGTGIDQGIMKLAWNPVNKELEAGGPEVQSHPQLYIKLKVSLVYMMLPEKEV